MKATINKDGILTIESETELESYALKQWLSNNPVNATSLLFIATDKMYQKNELRPPKPNFPEDRITKTA